MLNGTQNNAFERKELQIITVSQLAGHVSPPPSGWVFSLPLSHLHECLWRELPIGAVALEPLVPLLDGVLVVSGRRLEELQVLLGQAVASLAALLAHRGFCI